MRSSAATALVVALGAAVLALGVPQASAATAPSAARPSASLSGVDCTSGGAFANLNNTGSQPAAFTISVDGSVLDTVELGAGSYGESQLVPLTEDQSSTIAVAADGMATVTTTLMADCVVAGTPVTALAAATTAPTARTTGARDADASLPDDATGPFSDVPTGAWAALGAALALGGAALLTRRARREGVPAR